jgi:iron complex outermembrane recepter protein
VGDSYSANNAQVNPLHRPEYNIADLRIGVRNARYEVTAFVRNLTNEHANLGDAILIGAQVPGQPRFVINQPRTIGLEARVRFQ